MAEKRRRSAAHSDIERRRRNKINNEFLALRRLVPACAKACKEHGDGSLHKLTVLQATVDYVRYLEHQMQQHAKHNKMPPPPALPLQPSLPPSSRPEAKEYSPEAERAFLANATDVVWRPIAGLTLPEEVGVTEQPTPPLSNGSMVISDSDEDPEYGPRRLREVSPLSLEPVQILLSLREAPK
ncbi:hypothetical protein CANCADRAFT_128048 [Tortispora caseinolytica NRRL Y-17796]|uniref:BHLH domain-containing protein n=1 Tax=Tortispora caseinolytica NRRL Y-17796 TaxID=767744 RepID=A0A1E4TAI4_9ASCO|nr:hypothetical protein CANCADRAFT_128048 [Tortispora caseinolytica NRRL Y-17796]